MVLDRWPDNFFAETEQVAFCPSHIVPGIDFSNDPLLQGRLFSYLDTQLSRLGSPNFHQLPVNAPKCPFANQQRDGHMQMQRAEGPGQLRAELARRRFAARDAGRRLSQRRRSTSRASSGRIRAETFADHYSQARLFYRSQTAPEQAHIASALVFELSKVETRAHPRGDGRPPASTSTRTSAGASPTAWASMPLPRPPAPRGARSIDMAPSPALQLIGKMKDTLEGRAVAILVADGSDGALVAALKKAALDAGATRQDRRAQGGRRRSSRTARRSPPTGSSPARRRCCSMRSR